MSSERILLVLRYTFPPSFTDFRSFMRTFWIQALGCKVNQYESEQIAALLRGRGLVAVDSPQAADLRVINTCSVTIQAASKSRQSVRRSVRLPVLQPPTKTDTTVPSAPGSAGGHARTLVTGCWATSDPETAKRLPGVDAVVGHHDDVAAELHRLIDRWLGCSDPSDTSIRLSGEPPTSGASTKAADPTVESRQFPEPLGDDLSMIQAGVPRLLRLRTTNKPQNGESVKEKLEIDEKFRARAGTRSLPLLGQRQTAHQRAFLKVQDGCDAHCTYCIIPQLRPSLWSKPIDDVVDEARRMVDAGHIEIVLTGIFLGAYGHQTALRRRQSIIPITASPLARLVHALCTKVPGMRRLRFSSLEPGDLTRDLIDVLRSHPQVVPHFHLPLQSGSDLLLRRMNRQYTRGDFLRMIDDVHHAFDRPAITTDIIVGFPGETDEGFAQTLDIVDRVKFIHTHAFSFSPRPGTAAARWTDDFVHGPVVNQRIQILNARALQHSFAFRQQFVGETVQLLVEQQPAGSTIHHGRSERYFDVHFESDRARAGDAVAVTIEQVTPVRTFGRVSTIEWAHKIGQSS
jgi:MiaB/RimO family radical SAM methylthiotransferase